MFDKIQDSITQAVNSFLSPNLANADKTEIEGSHQRDRGYRWGEQAENNEFPLSACRAGDQLTIRRIVGRGPVRRRLLEMGLNPGTELRVVKYAPMKDPLECVIKGYHIALRVAEARQIIVTPQT